MMGGACTGGAFVEKAFEERRECRDCHFLDGYTCQVLEGLDKIRKCPALEEHIRYEGIKLYGVNK